MNAEPLKIYWDFRKISGMMRGKRFFLVFSVILWNIVKGSTLYLVKRILKISQYSNSFFFVDKSKSRITILFFIKQFCFFNPINYIHVRTICTLPTYQQLRGTIVRYGVFFLIQNVVVFSKIIEVYIFFGIRYRK